MIKGLSILLNIIGVLMWVVGFLLLAQVIDYHLLIKLRQIKVCRIKENDVNGNDKSDKYSAFKYAVHSENHALLLECFIYIVLFTFK